MNNSNDPSAAGTNRLRRRSFFESMDPDPSSSSSSSATTMEVIPLHDINESSSSLSFSSNPSAVLPAGVSDSSSTPPLSSAPGNDDSSPPSSSSSTSKWSARALLALLLSRVWYVKTWALVKLQSLEVNSRLARTLRSRIRRGGDGSTETLVVKHYAYPTHYIKLACASLVLLQAILFQFFQIQYLDLHVDECVFNEKMMPPLPSRERILDANTAAMSVLERRFEIEYATAQTRKDAASPRLPWNCISIVPSLTGESEDSKELAQLTKDLSWLLPRSHIVQPDAVSTVASRLHLALGTSSSPVVIERGAETGMLAAMVPLVSIGTTVFPKEFPDLFLVKTEHALKRLVLFRHERHEQLQLRQLERGEDDLQPSGAQTPEFGVFLFKTTVPDIYDRHMEKDWDAFLHVVSVGDQGKPTQFTQQILTIWQQHPEWPTLYVRFQNSLGLCGSFVRFASTLHQDTDEGDLAARHMNLDITCEAADNTPKEIRRLQNHIGIHLFPVSPDVEEHEERVLESAAAGAIVVTYNTPVMKEWIPDECGLRIGKADQGGSLLERPQVHVTSSEIEKAVSGLLSLDRVHRVAAGRAARVHYLQIRTHFFSAMAALDSAVCEVDVDESLEVANEIDQRSRKKVDMDRLRVFLY